MAPSSSSSTTYQSPQAAAAQDAFDANLNQTIFVFAFVLAGLVQLGVLGYLGYWLYGKYRKVRTITSDDIPHKNVPRQLMLPNRADRAASFPRKFMLSPLLRSGSTSPGSDYSMKDLERQDTQWSGPLDTPGGSTSDWTPSNAPRLSVPLPPPLDMEIDLGAYDDDFDVLSSSSAATVVQVIDASKSDDSIPRIVVEDFAPHAIAFFDDSDGSETDCYSEDMSIDDAELLVVPPMTWNAPRELVDEEKMEQIPLELPTMPSDSSRKVIKKSKSISHMFGVLSEITNSALRPKAQMQTSLETKGAHKSKSKIPKSASTRLRQNTIGSVV